jgi:1-acyl-sn-glycerol-3-phosphate acyltransferase
MLFGLLKFYARLAIRIYCRKIIMNRPELLKAEGPILFAANHPNSFLDGIILTTLLDGDLYSLTRGDAFKSKRFAGLLRWLHLLPIYRTSEGVENLGHNYTTFAVCQEVFMQKGMVIIFSEGGSENEWHLRPLRKGTARLAISSWEKGIDLTVIPVGFNYSSFRSFGKNIFINFGNPLNRDAILEPATEGRRLLCFNDQLRARLEKLVFEIDPQDRTLIRQKLYIPQPVWKKFLLGLPAALGFVLHAPLYYIARSIAGQFDREHFDGVVVGICMLFYLWYLPLLLIVCGWLLGIWAAVLCLVFIPFTAWACVQLKPQLDF